MSESPAGRRLCVFGDLIRDGAGWAGVAHTVEAAVAAVGEGWTVTAATRVGADDMEEAREALSRLGAVEMEDRIARGGSTPHLDPETGAVRDRGGAWPVDVLRTVITGADALYVAFASGTELDAEGLEALSALAPGAPIFVSFTRLPDPSLAGIPLRGAAGAQVTGEGARLLVPEAERGEAAATALLSRGLSLVVVLTGGEALIASARGRAQLLGGPAAGDPEAGRPIVHHLPGPRALDAAVTDAWGATFFARLLAGDTLQAAASRAGLAADGGARGAAISPGPGGREPKDEQEGMG
jgi:hypothetical protein